MANAEVKIKSKLLYRFRVINILSLYRKHRSICGSHDFHPEQQQQQQW
jgi:hypothetical protein